MLRQSLPLFIALLCCGSSPSAFAQQVKPVPASTTKVVPPPLNNAPIRVAPQRDQVREAFAAAERGNLSSDQLSVLASHPLAGWIEYAQLKRDIDIVPPARAQAFLAKYKGQALEGAFRELWLAAASRRERPSRRLIRKARTGNGGRCRVSRAARRSSLKWTR